MSDLENPSGDTPAAPPAAPAAQPATPSPAPAVPAATPSGPDRSDWVPPYRLRETRESAIRQAQNEFAAREAALRAEAERYKAQLHSIVGVTPPADPEISAVRDQFSKLYPGLSRIEERADALEEIIARADDLQAQTDHYWRSYGQQTVDRLFARAEASLGSPLTEEGKRQLHASFTGFVSSSPELTARYANDPSIVDDFWKQFTSSFIDPVRRSASASVVGRVPGALPQDSPSGVPRVSPGPQPQNLDERAAAAWALYNHNKTT